MLRRPAFRVVKDYAQNGASLIGSIRSCDLRLPSENTVARTSKGDELISESSGCSPLQDFSLDHDRFARLSGYFEALRSKKEYFEAEIEMKERIAEQNVERLMRRCKGDMSEPRIENYVLPKVLPFPVETCNLDELIHLHALQNRQPVESLHSMGPNDNADLILWILKEFIYKLWGFHYSGVIHGNLKPQNVLIFKGECMFTSAVNDDSKSQEWKAPEQILHKTQTKASDMFTFGCILYFCITKGCHPFGNTPDQRLEKIMANKVNISGAKDYPDAYHMISLLLNPEPKLRPKANDVYSHPFFKNLRTKVQLLDDICFRASNDKDLKDELESEVPMLRNPNWRERLINYLRTHCYDTKQPFEDFKDVFGPQGSPNFFPSIFMGAYEIACKVGLKDHDWFEASQLSEEDFPYVEKNGFRCPFYFD